MIPNPLTAQPNHVARLSWGTGKQRQKVGAWLDMAHPAKVWEAAQLEQRKDPDRALTLDVMTAPTYKAKIVKSIDLHQLMGLGAAPEPASEPTPSPAAMSIFTPAGAPAQAAMTPQIVMPQVPPVAETPAGMDAMTRFAFEQQGRQLQQATYQQYELRQQLLVSEQEKASLKGKLDEALMDLRHKDREHKADIRDMEVRLRDEMVQDAKPTGMNGLMEAVSNPAHPLAGLIGLMASQLLPKGAGAASGAGDGTMGGHTKEMTDILNGIAELIPNEEVGTKLYLALAKILPHPDGLSLLQQLAGSAEPIIA